MSLLQAFISNYQTKNLFTKKDRLLIAVSGGVDSVALCRLCQLTGLDFGIAHCNFQLRGDESSRDEAFVKVFADTLNVSFYSIKFDTKAYAENNRLSTQVAARELRYNWFEEVRSANDYDYILTAHHADDNIETVLMAFFRGTGIKGLTGIKEKNGKLRRPLLFARRAELESFLVDEKLSFAQDESNLHDDYTRNYFRNTVLPMIAKVYPETEENMLNTIERMKETAWLYQEAVTQKRKTLVEQKGNEWYLPVLLLQQQASVRTLMYEIVKDFGFTSAQLTDILQLLQSDSGKYVLSATHRILRNRKHLIISPLQELQNSAIVIEQPGTYSFANGTITFKEKNAVKSFVTDSSNIALIDAKEIVYPLLLRRWRTGDYFYPLGMRKKKKVSRFLIDQKLSLFEKEKTWVIEMNKKIIWVVGYRIDDRFRLTNTTGPILQIEFRDS